MQLKRYELKAGRSLRTFEFVSEGKKGEIRKLIHFEPMNYPGLYNLAFGDYGPEGNIDDQTVTDNGDSEKVLATAVAAIYIFADKYPDAWYGKGVSYQAFAVHRKNR